VSGRLGVAAAIVGDELVTGDVEVADGRVARVGVGGGSGGGVAIPGLVDLQVNGFAGVDFLAADVEGYRTAGEGLLAVGVTAYQPTFITSPEQTLLAALGELGRVPGDGPRIIGAHVEGPFLSPARTGAHPPAWRRDPDLALLRRILDAGVVTQVTLAPELDGALALVDELVRCGVLVSCGHSDATADEAHAAFDAGARTVTHLFNAMRPLRPRDPGIVGAALARDDVVVQIIGDLHHLAPEIVVAVRGAARGRLALVSDAVAAAGMGDGPFQLGDVAVIAEDGAVRRVEDGTLAGSAAPLIAGVRNLVALGVPLAEAVHAASTVPAALVGRGDLGLLAAGRSADIVVIDDRLEVQRVLVAGRERLPV
jgi:N-acetylglucosamine-6-phosphate deacetylase